MIIERMASELAIPKGFIASLARGASHEYKEYPIPKRTGGTRIICHPSRRLKALQRWLQANVIAELPLHQSAAAYRKGRSILDNANVHTASRYLLRMDFANFFPSITRMDIKKYITERPNLFVLWTVEDISVFCDLVCRDGVLTIGAPSSPGLSNAVCYDMDVQISTICSRSQTNYTRYADDLFFSTGKANVLQHIERQVIQVVSELGLPANLAINPAKTRHSSKRGARRVTGIVLSSDGRSCIGRKLKRRIRALIHRYEKLDGPARASLAGLIAFAIGLDPAFMNRLIDKYGLRRVRAAMMHTDSP